ncbi:MAG: M20 family metallopeptidase [Anaerovoracaceae bacterium]
MDIEKIIKEYDLEKKIISIRRQIHANPDLSEHEENTMSFVSKCLDEWGIEYKTGFAKTGIVAIIKGQKDGKVIALRGDMDALPIDEETGLEFASQKSGVMHACGHDAHISILLIVAFILKQIDVELKGSVKFFFQPAEETIGGAKRMIEDGCMENPEVDYVLGLHVEPAYDTGKVGIRYGKMYASSDMIDVTITGKGAHGAHPNEGIDAIIVATNVLNTIQTVVSRNVSPLDSVVCTFGMINGGTVRNQIADHVRMEGIIRTLDVESRVKVREKVGKICKNISEAMDANIEYKVMESYGPLINNDQVTGVIEKNAIETLGKENVILEKEPDLSCEDFSYFALKKPACYFHLGCYAEKNGPRVDLHHPKFTIDENCLMTGVKLQIKNVITLLNEGV